MCNSFLNEKLDAHILRIRERLLMGYRDYWLLKRTFDWNDYFDNEHYWLIIQDKMFKRMMSSYFSLLLRDLCVILYELLVDAHGLFGLGSVIVSCSNDNALAKSFVANNLKLKMHDHIDTDVSRRLTALRNKYVAHISVDVPTCEVSLEEMKSMLDIGVLFYRKFGYQLGRFVCNNSYFLWEFDLNITKINAMNEIDFLFNTLVSKHISNIELDLDTYLSNKVSSESN